MRHLLGIAVCGDPNRLDPKSLITDAISTITREYELVRLDHWTHEELFHVFVRGAGIIASYENAKVWFRSQYELDNPWPSREELVNVFKQVRMLRRAITHHYQRV